MGKKCCSGELLLGLINNLDIWENKGGLGRRAVILWEYSKIFHLEWTYVGGKSVLVKRNTHTHTCTHTHNAQKLSKNNINNGTDFFFQVKFVVSEESEQGSWLVQGRCTSGFKEREWADQRPCCRDRVRAGSETSPGIWGSASTQATRESTQNQQNSTTVDPTKTKTKPSENIEAPGPKGAHASRNNDLALGSIFSLQFISVQFSHSVVSDFLRFHEPQHTRPPCPSPTPGVHPNPCPLSRWCHPTISSSVVPFSSWSQSFPASRSFQMS